MVLLENPSPFDCQKPATFDHLQEGTNNATENFGSHHKKFVIDGKNMKRITKNARK